MKQKYLFIILFFSSLAFSQEEAWVYFIDKPSAQIYFESPSKMLSPKALYRRETHNIRLDNKDVLIEKTYIDQVKSSTGITVMAKSKWMNALFIRGTEENINALKSLGFVEKVEFANKALNPSAKKAKETIVVSKENTHKMAVDFNYGNATDQIQMLNGQVLHQKDFTGSGKVIAVIDAGFPGVDTALPFKRLKDNNQILGGYDFVSRNENFYTGSAHGTEVLSTIGGYLDGALVGTAPDASFYLFITEDDVYEGPLEESLWVEAAEKADSLGVDIITTSLGYFGDFTTSSYSHTYSDMNGITNFISRGADIAFEKGIFVLASAGNEGNSLEKHIGSPADAIHVLTVGAVNSSKAKVGFSSIGPSKDGRIKPDIMAQGLAVYVSDEAGNIITSNGTSFSCPIMAGMIACLWQAFPDKTNQEIREFVLKSSDRFTNPDNNYGYGIPDFSKVLSDNLEVTSYTANRFLIYPNPTDSVVSFVLSEEVNEAKITIYSTLGKKIIENTISNFAPTLSVQTLDKGIYFYTLEANNFYKSGKLIKQ